MPRTIPTSVGLALSLSSRQTQPRLPAELLLNISSNLQQQDLVQVSRANKFLRLWAQPLLYRFASFSKFGLFFLGAPNVFPFLDIAQLGVKKLPDDDLERICSKLKTVTVQPHDSSECAAFVNLGLAPWQFEADVLMVECRGGPVSVLGSEGCLGEQVHTDVHPPHSAEHYDCECEECISHCWYLETLGDGNMKVGKVVVRNASVCWYGTGNHFGLPNLRTVKEYVAVVNSMALPSHPSAYVDNCGITAWGIKPDLPVCLDTITLVFWSGVPGNGWLWPCHHFAPALNDQGNLALDGTAPRSCVASILFWNNLGRHLTDSLHAGSTLKIIGAELIVEELEDLDGMEMRPKARNIGYIQALVTTAYQMVFKQRIEEADAAGFAHQFSKWEERIEFLGVEDWLKTGEGEGVFTREEMEPFLPSA